MSSHFLPGEKRNIRTALCTQNVSLQQGHSEERQRGHSSGRLGLILNLEGGAERKETVHGFFNRSNWNCITFIVLHHGRCVFEF